MPTPFHLAIQVRDIEEARQFYGELMGFAEGRSSEDWVDFDMFGHQLVVHLNPALGAQGKTAKIINGVDQQGVPVPHFGVVLGTEQWEALKVRVQTFVDEFIIDPYTRFKGEPGEQSTMFFSDPSGNSLEFKAFKDIEADLFRAE